MLGFHAASAATILGEPMGEAVPRQEIYFSVDIEADGPITGMNSMLSMGVAAFDIDKRLLGTFSRNLAPLPGAYQDPRTMSEFWAKNPGAWAEATRDPVEPEVAMPEFVSWVREVAGQAKPIAVAYPAVWDFKWVDYYALRFAGENPFGFGNCVDIKAVAWRELGGNFGHAAKRNFPKRWFDPMRHTHVAVEDAVEQGALFVNMLRDIRGLERLPPVQWEPEAPADFSPR